MKRLSITLTIASTFFALLTATSRAAQPISPTHTSLGLFKNGVAVVEDTYQLPAPGNYTTAFPTGALHGAFFVESGARVSTTSTREEQVVPFEEAGDIDWTRDFEGRSLRVTLPGESEPSVVTVMSAPKRDQRAELVSNDPYVSRNLVSASQPQGVLLKTLKNEVVWIANAYELRSVVAIDGAPAEVKREREVLNFEVGQQDFPEGGTTLTLSYLVRGICWAPQYRIETIDQKELTVEQTAVVVNDWRELDGVEVVLYSGYPQIPLQNAKSPLSTNVALSAFFAALRGANSSQMSDMAYLSQNATSNYAMNGASMSSTLSESAPADPNDGYDIVATALGKLTLKKGDRALFTTGKGKAEYERVAYWNIRDIRDGSGRAYDANYGNNRGDARAAQYGRTTNGERVYESTNPFEEPWDVIKFKNPLAFPLTTGPASIYVNGKFLAQNSLYWTNPKEEALLPVTKALSVRVRSIENERPFVGASNTQGQMPNGAYDINAVINGSADAHDTPRDEKTPSDWGQTVILQSARYRVACIDAEIVLTNQRGEPTPIRLSRQFSGNQITKSFEGFETMPEIATLTPASSSNARQVNPQNELRCDLILQPNETRTLKFSYRQLVLL